MKSLLRKDKTKRKVVFNQELLQLVNKFLFVNLLNNKKVDDKTKSKIVSFFCSKKGLRISKTQIVRRCILTNRGRVSNRILGVSRIKLREMLLNGVFPGFTKAVW